MTGSQIPSLRLYNHRLTSTSFEAPGDVVDWLGAIQAQDYLGALWAVGQRTRAATERDIEAALANRTLVRTWPMRGTLHFVAAGDAHWMLELLARRVIARNAARLQREYSLDETAFAHSRKVIAQALQGGVQLTRNALYRVLEAAQIPTAGGRGLQILWWIAQEGLICFGPRQGKQQTFVLLDEWVPDARRLERDEALAVLTRRYFTSHGPATQQDFMWWSGLTAQEAQVGLDGASPHLVQEAIDGQAHWWAASMPLVEDSSLTVHLLPAYDEYTVAYKERRPVTHPSIFERKDASVRILNPTIVVNGTVTGNWKRALKKEKISLEIQPITPLEDDENRLIAAAASRYAAFLGLRLEMG